MASFEDTMNISDIIVETIAKILLYLGGGASIIFILSSWLGKVWANRILEKDKHKYQRELEKIKNSYQQELENYKDQLEKMKSKYLRYSEYQFKLYNDLWGSLTELQQSANALWINADTINLGKFVKQLRLTLDAIERNRLLIEEEHYKQLMKIISAFLLFKIGKTNLINIMMGNYTAITPPQEADNDIRRTVNSNQKIKDEYSNLLNDLIKEFKKQII